MGMESYSIQPSYPMHLHDGRPGARSSLRPCCGSILSPEPVLSLMQQPNIFECSEQ